MDSDLPLLEIAGEDDSLIQQTPIFKPVAVADTFFSISPLQVPISSAESIRHNVAPDTLNCSSPKCSNKENLSLNKLEGPKLSMDPLQMKRRKKCYNLRKSLAWDKAFFTDEGVLDPHELSIITGTNGKSRGGALSVINEEVSKSPYSGSSCKLNSGSLQHRKYGGLFMPQQRSPASDKLALNSQVMQEVHFNDDSSCRRSGAKSGRCPRPSPSSSPANVHTIRNALKSAKKDSDLPNIPDHKQGPCSLPKTNKNCIPRTSQLKRNPIAPPTVNTHKGVSLASSSKNVTSSQNKAKSGANSVPLAAKVSVQHCRESLVKSSLEVNALTNPQPSQVTKPIRNSEVNQNPGVASNIGFSDGQHRPRAVTGLLPHNTPMTMGNAAEIQKKPSGLRMPSPSLGYFGQHITQPKSIPKATGHGPQKLVHEFRTPNARTTSTINSDILAKPITVGLSSSMQGSEVTTSSAATHKPIKSYLKINEVKNVDIPVLPDKGSDIKSSRLEVHGDIGTEDNIAWYEKHRKTKEVGYEDVTNNQTLLERGTCKQFRQDNHDKTIYMPIQNHMINVEISQCIPQSNSELHAVSVHEGEDTASHQGGEKELQNHSLTDGITSELQSEIHIKCKVQKTLTVHNDSVNNSMQELSDPFIEKAEIVEHSTHDAIQVPDVESHGCKVSKDTTRNMGVTDSVGPSSGGTELDRDYFSFQNQLSDQDAYTILHKLSTNSNPIEGKPQEHSDISNITISKSKVSTSSENSELHSPCFGDEQTLQSASELYTDKFLAEEANPSNGTVILEKNEVRKSESNVSKVSSVLSPGRSQDGEFVIKRVAEQPPVESQFDLAEISHSVDIQDCSIDTHFRHEVELTGNANSSDVGTPFISEESCSLVQSDQVSFDESDGHNLRNDAIMEGVATDSCVDAPTERETIQELQNQCIGRTAENMLLLRDFSEGGEAKSSQHLCDFQNVHRTQKDASRVDVLTVKSHVGDSYQKITVSTEQFREESNLSGLGIVFDQCSEDSLKSSMEEKDPSASIKQSERDAKPNSVIMPLPDAVPFSDEWLAAVEAAGEDILTMKGGAVQNSPPDKSLPEPSPWSPVKRKTIEIGPFDCTKFTNTQPAEL